MRAFFTVNEQTTKIVIRIAGNTRLFTMLYSSRTFAIKYLFKEKYRHFDEEYCINRISWIASVFCM
jgi:hypothetical protein